VLLEVQFFRKIWLLFDLVNGQNLLLAGVGFFGYFCNISAKNWRIFVPDLSQCFD